MLQLTEPTARRMGPAIAGAGAVFVAGCSLIKTSDLSCGSDICTYLMPSGPSSEAGADAAVDAGADGGSDGGVCQANTMTDVANCGTCGHACASASACLAGTCRAACTGGILYVSPSGSDTYDGCTGALPLATVGAAIARSAEFSSAKQEIHVCAGSYQENLAPITTNVVLRGGYNCTTWSRTGTYGYPTFDAVNETRLGSSPTVGNGATLTFRTAAVDPSTVVDGLTVLLSTNLVPPAAIGFGTAGDAYGILSTGSAVPTITNVHVSAGATSAARSIGIGALHASARVTSNLIEAGAGQHGIGVYFFADVEGALIQNNTVHGGAATETTSEGIEVSSSVPMTGANAIRGNVVEGGTGADGAIGIKVSDTNVALVDNVISGGASACTQSCASFGVLVHTSTNNFLADSNRIVGSTGATAGYAMYTASSSSPIITNNVLFGGTNPASSALVFYLGSNGVARHNTVASVGNPIMTAAHANATIENNLAISMGPGTFFLVADDCTSGSSTTFASIAGNAAVGFAGNLLAETTACTTPVAPGLAGLAAHFGSVVGTNVRIDDSCSDETTATMPSCSATTACASSVGACGASIVAATDSPSDASDAALDRIKGYPLTANAPCLVTKGGVDRTSSVPLDVLGVTRTAPVSIGAYEDDATCP